MALYKAKDELPSDAVKINENDAAKYQWDIIKQWKPSSDVWPLKYGAGVLGISGALQAILINVYYRRKLNLRNFGSFSSYLPNVALPGVIGQFFHTEFITRDILLQKTPCPMCVELRSMAFHTFFSSVYPVILAPLSGFLFANRHYTYCIPSVKEPGKVLKLFVKLTRPVGNTLFTSFMIQALLAIGVTYYEARSLATVHSKLVEMEKNELV